MRIIDADKFLQYLIFSKHIDGLTCGEVKEAIEMCKVDILDKIRAEITELRDSYEKDNYHDEADALRTALAILDKNKAESEDNE